MRKPIVMANALLRDQGNGRKTQLDQYGYPWFASKQLPGNGQLRHPQVSRSHCSARRSRNQIAPEKRKAVKALHGGGDRAKRSSARGQTLRSDHLATMVSGQPAIGSKAAPNAGTAEAAPKPECTVSNCRASA
jgi:hypothetical protein